MRQFKIWNASRTLSFDFVGQGCIITDVSGLGIGFNPILQNKTVVDFESNFDEVSLQVTFGIETNPYTVFNNFANFIANNGKNNLVLEYSVNGRTIFCDVWVKNLQKSQKTVFNVLQERISFVRITYWYQIETGVLPTHPTELSITNNVLDDIPVSLEIMGPSTSDFGITLYMGSNIASEVKLTIDLSSTQSILIDSESKKVTLVSSGVKSNAYNAINHSKDTFIQVPMGTFGLTKTTSVVVNYSIKKWVID